VSLSLAGNGTVTGFDPVASGFGKVLQVVSAVKTDTFTTTSATYTAVTGMTATITPSSASSKVLVMVDLKISAIDTTQGAHVRLLRDSTAIYIGDASGSRVQSSTSAQTLGDAAGDFALFGSTLVFLDSPGAATATTYSIEMRRGTAGTALLNRSGNYPNDARVGLPASSITVIEVAA